MVHDARMPVFHLIVLLFTFIFALIGCASDPFIKKLQHDIEQAPYSSEDYIPNEFDCSNMTNFLDDWLEEKGYDTKILVYYIDSSILSRSPLADSHALLLVNNSIIVESVTKKVLKNKHPQNFIGALIFQDAETLLNWTPEEKWSREWGYNRYLSMKNNRKLVSFQLSSLKDR